MLASGDDETIAIAQKCLTVQKKACKPRSYAEFKTTTSQLLYDNEDGGRADTKMTKSNASGDDQTITMAPKSLTVQEKGK